MFGQYHIRWPTLRRHPSLTSATINPASVIPSVDRPPCINHHSVIIFMSLELHSFLITRSEITFSFLNPECSRKFVFEPNKIIINIFVARFFLLMGNQFKLIVIVCESINHPRWEFKRLFLDLIFNFSRW